MVTMEMGECPGLRATWIDRMEWDEEIVTMTLVTVDQAMVMSQTEPDTPERPQNHNSTLDKECTQLLVHSTHMRQ